MKKGSDGVPAISRRGLLKGAGAAGLVAAGIIPITVRAAGGGASEAQLRQRLAIPPEAAAALVFAQSSHVDPDWLLKADQYQYFTDRAFAGAMVELARDPRYVYSVECVFFFRRFWEGHPDLQPTLRDYVNRGRIRFTGVGVTTPDTLLPEAENILRDYVVGLAWLRAQGLAIDARIAYLPDDFGHSPTVPSMLRELGISYAAMTRIDGGYAPTADFRPAKDFPRPGSSAEMLFKQLLTTDFIWAGPDGAEIIAHAHPTAYDMGDMIDHAAIGVMMGVYLGVPTRGAGQTNKKIDGYVARLRPLSKTGYMFCPLGGDFNVPVKDLCRIIDAYNRLRYPTTGVWATMGGLEDYMDLVAFHRDLLPTIKLDPNPYWTGFYSSRPGLKQACRKLSRSLYLAEALGVMAEARGAGVYPDLTPAWEIAAMSNHHDFVTGTSRNTVLNEEQLPLMAKAQAEVDDAITRLAAPLSAPLSPRPAPLKWKLDPGGMLTADNEFYAIELDPRRGGCITRWLDRASGREIMAGPSNDVVVYRDSGGMYMMGMEVYQGTFKELARASAYPAEVTAREEDGVLKVTVDNKFAGHAFTRELFLRSDSPAVRMKLRGRARGSRSVTVRFQPALVPGRFVQAVTYGVVERPLEKLFNPTFWAVKDWVDLVDQTEKFGAHLAVAAPGAVSARADGSIEAVALRNARAERAHHLPALQTVVANGTDPAEHEFDYAFWPHGSESWLQRRAWDQARLALADEFIAPGHPDLPGLAATLIKLDRPDVIVAAVKKAAAGDGVVVRLHRLAPGPVKVLLAFPGRPVQQAARVDALERELAPLPIAGGQVEIDLPSSLATVRVRY
jgi:hypothetical protein